MSSVMPSSKSERPVFPLVAGNESSLNKKKHISYWKRCLKTYLPEPYTSSDSNRMLLVLFAISALDLLGSLVDSTTPDERADYCKWIYSCQHPEGGFRGYPAVKSSAGVPPSSGVWHFASVPATFFALNSLAILGDDLSEVRRRDCLQWLRRIQRPNGSFGEFLGLDGSIEGGTDTRFGYCATGIRWILREHRTGAVEGVPDIDVDGLVECIRKSETYDGGMSEAPFHEAHAGFTYCAIAALSFIDRLPLSVLPNSTSPSSSIRGLSNLPLTIHWLISRQTATLDEEDAIDTNADETDSASTCHDAHSFVKLRSFPSEVGKLSHDGRPTSNFDLQWIGFNGRCNKIADTCYAFWVTGALDTLNRIDLISPQPSRRYLLDKTQHLVGGFGKAPGDPPDMYHSYLGLATLAILGDKAVKPICSALCVSLDTKARIEGFQWRKDIIANGSSGASGE